jgi:hypothetical protein
MAVVKAAEIASLPPENHSNFQLLPIPKSGAEGRAAASLRINR